MPYAASVVRHCRQTGVRSDDVLARTEYKHFISATLMLLFQTGGITSQLYERPGGVLQIPIGGVRQA